MATFFGMSKCSDSDKLNLNTCSLHMVIIRMHFLGVHISCICT